MIRLPKLKITKKISHCKYNRWYGTGVPGLFLVESKETRFWAFVPVIDAWISSTMRSGPYTTRYFCSYAPRLDISLKKNTATLKFDLDLPVAEFQATVFAKKYFRTGSIFFRIYKLQLYFFKKKPIFRNVSLPAWKYFFCEYHRLEYRDR